MKRISLILPLPLIILLSFLSAPFPCLAQTDTFLAGSDFNRACERGDLPSVKYLAGRNHFSELVKTSEGIIWRGSFASAAQNGHVQVCEYLISAGAPANWGILEAVQHNQVEVVRLLIKHKAHLKSPDVLKIAAGNGNLIIVKLLVEAGLPVPLKDGWYDISAFHLAAQNGHLPVVKYFVESGVPVNLLTKSNYTALLYAAIERRTNVCDYLLSVGARTDIFTEAALGREERVKKLLATKPELINSRFASPDGNDFTPAHFAASAGRLNILKLLSRKGVNIVPKFDEAGTPLHASAGEGRYQTVMYLLNLGANPDAMENNGCESPLNGAVRGGHIKTAELLLDREAKVDRIAVNMGQRALQIAVDRGDLEMCRMLIAHGANVRLGSLYDRTPLHVAPTAEIARLLIRNGARVNATETWRNCTPLNFASYTGYSDVVRVLIQNGADVNHTCEGLSPLLAAADRGHKDIVSQLLTRKVDVNQTNHDEGWPPSGNTALHLAASFGHIDVVALLISKGAKVNLRNLEGLTPLSLAEMKGNFYTSDFIRSHGGLP